MANHNDNCTTLLAFSLGKLDSGQVFKRLGIDSDEDLFLLMAHARLPMPRLPEAETERMVDQLMQLGMDQS